MITLKHGTTDMGNISANFIIRMYERKDYEKQAFRYFLNFLIVFSDHRYSVSYTVEV